MPSLLPASGSQPVVIADPTEVERLLREHFGFGIVECTAALEAGHARAALATSNSAVSQFGSDFYFGTIEQWRDELAKHRYEPKRFRGLELARRRDNGLQVTACMASDGVGQISGNPKPKNPKGSSSKKAIRNNQGTLGLLAPGEAWDPIETWWLLYQVQGLDHARSINAEVSMPNDMTSPREFGWNTRLILPTLELNESAIAPELPKPAQAVEVPVIRRAS